ncbi:MAG: ATP-binding cassette domain-containing protein [Fibrobacteres bacterium]|nr:ATP-binding cassette domain-containing protein [Fibrobacterota bacterium]
MSSNTFSISVKTGERSLVDISDYVYEKSKITFLFGESGIGKSVISKVIYGILDPHGLDIKVNGSSYSNYRESESVKELQKSSFFVFQEPSTHLNPQQKIYEQLNEGSLSGADSEKQILSTLWTDGTVESLKHILDIFPKPYRPSGGEKQRVLLAMAFKKIDMVVSSANSGTEYFVFDEPTGSLDNRYRNIFLEYLVNKFKEKPYTVTVITHDYSIISEVYTRYGDIIESFRFKELVRNEDETLCLNDFSPEKYTGWLFKMRKLISSAKNSEKILEFSQDLKVFGRELTLSSPLIIRRGEMVYLKAASGVGKTTLAKVIMGLYKADRFSMNLSGVYLDQNSDEGKWHKEIWGKKGGMVFQHADEALNLAVNVREVFKNLPLKRPVTDASLTEMLSALLTQKLPDGFLERKVSQLSGGQKQCLNLLRTFLIRPDLIVLDEPLNGLDFSRIRTVLGLISNGLSDGSAILMITHNEEIMEHLVNPDQVWYLSAKE